MALKHNPHQQGCPWYEYAEKYGYPDVKWCEETLCSWISEPANTWSNLAYIFVAIALFYLVKRDQRADLLMAPICALFAGVVSFVWHASNFYYTQILDFAGAFSFLVFIIVFNFKRAGVISVYKRSLAFILILGFHVLLMIIFYNKEISVRLSAIPLVSMLIASELLAWKKGADFRPLTKAIGAGLIGVIFLNLDKSTHLCDPRNHFFQGHAAWHVFTAIAIFFAYQYYRQFSMRKE